MQTTKGKTVLKLNLRDKTRRVKGDLPESFGALKSAVRATFKRETAEAVSFTYANPDGKLLSVADDAQFDEAIAAAKKVDHLVLNVQLAENSEEKKLYAPKEKKEKSPEEKAAEKATKKAEKDAKTAQTLTVLPNSAEVEEKCRHGVSRELNRLMKDTKPMNAKKIFKTLVQKEISRQTPAITKLLKAAQAEKTAVKASDLKGLPINDFKCATCAIQPIVGVCYKSTVADIQVCAICEETFVHEHPLIKIADSTVTPFAKEQLGEDDFKRLEQLMAHAPQDSDHKKAFRGHWRDLARQFFPNFDYAESLFFACSMPKKEKPAREHRERKHRDGTNFEDKPKRTYETVDGEPFWMKYVKKH